MGRAKLPYTLYVIIGHGDEEQCCDRHQYWQVKVRLYGRQQSRVRTPVCHAHIQ